jgi:hypothetical protein
MRLLPNHAPLQQVPATCCDYPTCGVERDLAPQSATHVSLWPQAINGEEPSISNPEQKVPATCCTAIAHPHFWGVPGDTNPAKCHPPTDLRKVPPTDDAVRLIAVNCFTQTRYLRG